MKKINNLERRIYSEWAFSNFENEKAKINFEIYMELTNKYKVYRDDCSYAVDIDILKDDTYDVIIGRLAGYNHAEYKVYKNKPNLTDSELALLCDEGNLCFGYKIEESKTRYYVFED